MPNTLKLSPYSPPTVGRQEPLKLGLYSPLTVGRQAWLKYICIIKLLYTASLPKLLAQFLATVDVVAGGQS